MVRQLRRGSKSAAVMACAVSLVVVLAACSSDAVVWGVEGADVRDSAAQFISDAQQADGSPSVCADSELDLGTPADWADLAPGEPVKYTTEHGGRHDALAPTWAINLSYHSTTEAPVSKDVPVLLSFRGSQESLCVEAIEWGPLTASTSRP